MKKLLLIALAGFMMTVFTQCGGGGVSGSQEYKDMMSYLKKAEKAIKSAKTCEQLEEAGEFFWTGVEDKTYAKEDQVTDEERTKVLEYFGQVGDVYNKASDAMGCE